MRFIDKNYDTGKFSQETLLATDYQPELIKKNDRNYFIDFGKTAFSKLKIRLSSSKNDSISIAVGEMKIKDHNHGFLISIILNFMSEGYSS